MDITVYLPDDIGTRAKEAELPFSRMLRDAVEEELGRRAAIEQTLSDGIEEHEVALDGYDGVITGKLLGNGETDDGVMVFLTDDERVLVYDGNRMDVQQIDYPEDPVEGLYGWLNKPEDLVAVMRDLGLKARVRL